MPKILSVYDFCFFKYTEMWYLMCMYVRALEVQLFQMLT